MTRPRVAAGGLREGAVRRHLRCGADSIRSDPPYGALEVEQVERPSQGQRHGWNYCF